MFDLMPLGDLSERQRLFFHSVDRVGDDLRLLARFSPR
jgi:diaminohydroxyphosphoribosylaminopyrimidine deaminase/5-amino-6-(5-phosphoribosylamino)uracil reductase